MTEQPDLFTRAKDVSIDAICDVKLYRAGRWMRGECPLCGASKGKKGGGAFSVNLEKGVWKCWSCEEHGDVIDLERELRGGTPREAAGRLVGAAPPPVGERIRPPPKPQEQASSHRLAAMLWSEARPAEHSAVRVYLQARGIHGPVLEAALAHLKFHPSAFWGFDEETGRSVRLPAMVARVVTASAATGGVHLTYLSADAKAKTWRQPAKLMFGPQVNAAGEPGGAWLIGPKRDWARKGGPLIVGEGIESTLSAAVLHGEPCRALSALTLGRLQGGWATDKWGRRNPDAPAADPEVPALTWPAPEFAPWPEVLIAVDRDMRPQHVKARRAGGGTWKRPISPDDRARVCASLAEQAWRKASPHLAANAVRAIAPAAGRDFNTELQARGGCQT